MSRPFLKSFLFCDSTRPRPDGTLDVISVWQQLGASQLPGRYPVGTFVCWANLTKRHYDMELRVHVPTAPEPFVVNVPVETQGNPRLDWMNTVVLELLIVAEGDIRYEILLDGEPYGECLLPVMPRG